MLDSFTEVSHQSWGSRLIESIKGVLVGIAMFVGAIALLAWNEHRAVVTAKSLTEGQGLVVSVKADAVDPAHQNKLVHVTGQATTTETLSDPVFGATAQAIKLVRTVKMYQWKETKKTEKKKELGGGERTETTYTYAKEWDDEYHDSSHFRHGGGHQNPAMKYRSDRFVAQVVTLGAFALTKDQIADIDAGEGLAATQDQLAKIADPALRAQAKLEGADIYLAASAASSPQQPGVGDLRVAFTVVKPTAVSLYAAQVGNSFAPFQTSAGNALSRLQIGTHTPEAMFAQAQSENAMLTWVLRGVGWLVMTIGLSLLFQPFVTFADVLPFLGNVLGFGVLLGSGVAAAGVSITTIAVAWIVVRPVLGVGLLAVAALGFFAFYRAGTKARNVRSALAS